MQKLVRTRGTSPQLHARIGGRAKRRRPNLWPYGWSILVAVVLRQKYFEK